MKVETKHGWTRPDDPLNVWQIVESQQKFDSNITKSIKFSIQEVPKSRHSEAMDLMMKYFVKDEPMSKFLNFKEDIEALNYLRVLWNYCLEQGITVAAYVLDSKNNISKLAAINMLYVVSDETDMELNKLLENYKSDKTEKIFNVMNEMSYKADVRKEFGVDKYIGAVGLVVSDEYRGQKLGLHLLNAREKIGKKYNISVTSTVFTAPASQILAERAGFCTKLIQNYSDVVDEKGNKFLTGIEAKDLRIMAKRFY